MSGDTLDLSVQTILTECGISEQFAAKTAEFLHYIMQANQTLNLMSRKLTADDILTDHIRDCLIGAKFFAEYNNIADLGTGGGFPGILLAIVYPDKHFDLFDKSVRKCEYLQNAKRDLKLKNIDIHNGLIAETDIKNDVITCRAFKPIPEIVDMTKKYFNRSGRYILYKGRMETITEELTLLQKRYKTDSTIVPLDNLNDKERNIVLLHKKD
ncbi:MAG: 16S rRNA (guanine(527)-N(7))-methyltransferase RsmG [Spirochaetales bacterium]|nr:16S rRNA (guanine(527)-N(7))-methyltransferase RsmG [Spirochaetales bacterium]